MSKCKENRCLVQTAAIVCVIVGLVMSIVALTIHIILKPENAPRRVCVTCSTLDHFRLSGDRELMGLYESLDRFQEDGEEKCCSSDTLQEASLYKLLSTKLPSQKAEANGNGFMGSSQNSLAFAQRTFEVSDSSTGRNDPTKTDDMYQMNINTDNVDPRYQLAKGVHISKKGIRIIHPGLYFIYKSVHFHPNSDEPCKKMDKQTFISKIIRMRSAKEDVLSTTEHTCCQECKHDRETGFGGGVFQLETEDLITVNVTKASLIHISKDVTYLGLMMVNRETV